MVQIRKFSAHTVNPKKKHPRSTAVITVPKAVADTVSAHNPLRYTVAVHININKMQCRKCVP